MCYKIRSMCKTLITMTPLVWLGGGQVLNSREGLPLRKPFHSYCQITRGTLLLGTKERCQALKNGMVYGTEEKAYRGYKVRHITNSISIVQDIISC